MLGTSRHLSQASAQARCSPARKLRAPLRMASQMQTTAIDQESGQIRNTTLLAHIASFSSAIRLGQKIERDSQCLCKMWSALGDSKAKTVRTANGREAEVTTATTDGD